jgi:hypothetical protein
VQERAAGSYRSTSARCTVPRSRRLVGWGWLASAYLLYKQHLVTIVGHIGASHETILEGETGAFCHEGGQWRSLFRPQSQARAEE